MAGSVCRKCGSLYYPKRPGVCFDGRL
ncbi:MAG: zinc ribbon domain-containing protein [Tannerellaceae bacterium]|nr:zinc ribbon domain-containing protein [Tannerellaceae bacterium]